MLSGNNSVVLRNDQGDILISRIKFVFIYFVVVLVHQSGVAFEVVAHRGVHQSYHRDGLNNETCTATKINKPHHTYLENTIESIEQAFIFGADIVEIDIHPTNEGTGPSNIIVFHDWTLNCRTEAKCDLGCRCDKGSCVTHGQSLNFLQSLDIGYGYTYDGVSYPFRGKGVGQMPSLDAVLNLLEQHRTKVILINQKDRMERTVEAFLRIISKYELDVRQRVLFPRLLEAYDEKLEELSVPESIYQSGKAKKCLNDYMILGWTGYFPESCRNLKFFVPIRESLERIDPRLKGLKVTDLLWGWPAEFIKRAHKHGSKVYASQVDSVEELNEMMTYDLDGIMTNKIELIGPF